MPETATLVSGTVKEKAVTPSAPQKIPEESAFGFCVVALFLLPMTQSSTSDLARELELWIAKHLPGDKLPSSRELVRQFSVSPVTVRNAIRDLSVRGLVDVRVGVGVFVRHRVQIEPADFNWQVSALGAQENIVSVLASTQRAAAEDSICLHSGYPDEELLPSDLVRRSLGRVGKQRLAHQRSPMQGLVELRLWFASKMPGFKERDVVIVPGTQSGLSAVLRAVAPKELIIESPSYWGTILAARQLGVKLLPVASDSEGPDAADLERILRTSSARAFYAQPNFGNPHGVGWSHKRREEIMDVLKASNAFLIEDDWAHDFALGESSTPIAAGDSKGQVIYLRSLTKVVSPAVRVGAIYAKGPVLQRIVAEISAEALYTSGILQSVALDVVKQPAYERHLVRVRSSLLLRRDALISALRKHAPSVSIPRIPQGGLNLWCRLPDEVDAREVAERCESKGVMVAHGRDWFPSEETGPFLRLNFSGPAPERYGEAAQVIEQAIAEAMGLD